MKFLQLVKSYFAIDRQISRTRRKIDASLAQAALDSVSIDKKISQQELLLVKMKEYERDIDNMSTALNAARSELEIAKDITVPALIAASETITSRWEAETKVNVMRATMAQNTGVNE